MSTPKTLANGADAARFIAAVSSGIKQQDSLALLKLFSEITGEKPVMWGTSIVGFGSYHYKSERSSQEGDWPLTGFSPRKQSLTIYVMPGFEHYQELLEKLGKHKTSKSCLYINKLSDVDMDILKKIIEKSYLHMKAVALNTPH
jgi:hypothetical protein